MKIIFTASECVPFAKTGGLADVVGALPILLNSKKQKTIVIIPKYKKIDEKKFQLKKTGKFVRIPLGNSIETGYIWETKHNNTNFYFVESQKYFDRDELYRTSLGDYPDNDERFIFFSRAVLETAKAIDYKPDIIHCHDWQVGLIPAYLKTLYRIDAFFNNTSTIITIHNIAYQGVFPKESLFLAGFSWHDFIPEKLEYYGQINFFKAGLVYSDVITTVSPTYACEIQSSNEFGRGLEGVIKSRSNDLYGIINGIDTNIWNPSTDEFIAEKYYAQKLDGKKISKQELQKITNLPQNPQAPLIGMVSRLDPMKGIDLLTEIIDELFVNYKDLQIVILGKGDQIYQDMLLEMAKKYSENLSVNIRFDDLLAHKIYAGSDFFLMPSKFEPCGLGQLIAMTYGTIPIVTKTGGLADTVSEFNPDTKNGTGFVCEKIDSLNLLITIKRALDYFYSQKLDQIIKNCLTKDFSWENSVKEYIKLYKKTLLKKQLD